jgi:hypothetical protein
MGTQYEEVNLDDTDNALEDLEMEVESKNIAEPKQESKEPRVVMSGQENIEVEYQPFEEDDVEVEIVDEKTEGKDGKEDQKKEEYQQRQRPKGPSRAQKRITKLAQQRKEAEAERDEYKRKLRELENKYSQTRYSTAKNQRDQAARRLQELEAAYTRADEEGNSQAKARITREMSDVNLRLRVLDYETAQRPQEIDPEPEMPQEPMVPEAAQAWLEDNPWMNDPSFSEKRQVTERVADELIRRGMNPNDDLFYDELDNALHAIEQHLIAQQNNQQEQEEPKEEPQEIPDERPAVQGRGRQAPRRPSRRKVRLTAAEKQMADNLGMAYEDYAKGLDEYNDNGWTEIS